MTSWMPGTRPGMTEEMMDMIDKRIETAAS
jgi:hypothetical protein